MSLVFKCKSLSELDLAAEKILKKYTDAKIFALSGEMGAGKTTLIKAFCSYLGVKEIVNSPTFALVNEYNSEKKGKIYHFDFYRINKLSEVFDMGYEDYFFTNCYCFIEWPEKIASLLPKDFVSLTITENDGVRTISY